MKCFKGKVGSVILYFEKRGLITTYHPELEHRSFLYLNVSTCCLLALVHNNFYAVGPA